MQSRILIVNEKTSRLKVALETAEEFAHDMALDHRTAMRLRLLTEETMGMLREMTDSYRALMWFEEEDGKLDLCLELTTMMNAEKKGGLLSLSKKSAGTRQGIMDKVRAAMEDRLNGAKGTRTWSLVELRKKIKEGGSEDEELLKRSIVGNIAEDITVSVKGDTVRMTISMPVA